MSRDRVIELLSFGYSQTVVASAVGVTDSYVSQVLSEEGVRDSVAQARTARLATHVTTDDSIDAIERDALAKVRSLLPFITDPMKAVRVFQVMNAASRKVTGAPVGNQQSSAPIVNLTLPAGANVMFKLSSDKQVTEVDGRSLATLPASALSSRLSERKEQRTAITDQSSASQLLEQLGRNLSQEPVTNVLSAV